MDWAGARWIGQDEVEPASELAGISWIWFPEGDPTAAAPVGTRYFRRDFELAEPDQLESARLVVAADNEFVAYLNGRELGKGSSFKVAGDFNALEALRAGPNVLAIAVKNVGDSPNPAALTARLSLNPSHGPPRLVVTDTQWRASDQTADAWAQPQFDATTWPVAQVIGPVGMPPWGAISGPEVRRLPARWLRREFAAQRQVTRATVHFSGLGLSELYLNGRKVGDQVLSPGLTEYTKRVYYVTHDVTGLVKPGANAIGALLGNGRYFAPRKGAPTETRTYGFPKLLLRLQLQYDDGSSLDLVSDDSWKLTTHGPIRANCEYDGEIYDARMELAGWAEPGYDDSTWTAPQLVAAPGGALVAQMIEPIRVVETRQPVSIKEIAPGVFIYDFGQNLVGWCRLKVSGPRDTTVTLRHAELLQPDGALYLDNLRGAKVTDTYILKGAGTELYEPRFTYHGFRYVELKGYRQSNLNTLEACVVHDDLENAGSWESSNGLLNRIHQNIHWGVRGNYRSIPTDCPQRDERQGWLGDRSAESKGEAFLFHTAALYAKWLQDMEDAQKDNGSVPDVCPPYWPIYSDNVTWPSSTVLIPEHLHTQFGDRAIIARHYPSMKRWIDYMAGFIQDDLMPRDNYGDWCVPPEDPKLIHSQDPARKTHPTLLGTAYYYHCLNLMSRYARMLGQLEDAGRFEALAARMKSAFNRRFLSPDGRHYDNGSQTSCVLPLAFNLVPATQRAAVFDHLVDKITRETRNHVGTGLIGGQYLMRTLTDGGRPDLAYTLASQRTYPSWGYMLEQGATTLWELWNGDTADPAMNSGNHVMLVGDLIIWMYEYLAGIQADPEQPGFKHILMKPHPVGDLRFVKATHRSPYGLIRSEWRRAPDSFQWDLTVPVNTTATVYMPADDATRITVNGKPLRKARNLAAFLRMEGDYALLALGSGTYRLVSREGR
ncbi:MAG: family 78 glycoside hydrolase catalytic domain [Verrucomicrobia bacterium]|nr:family 78 glycoside hydrolase catalytic domain [Verrucomicrobiota bacterium]